MMAEDGREFHISGIGHDLVITREFDGVLCLHISNDGDDERIYLTSREARQLADFLTRATTPE